MVDSTGYCKLEPWLEQAKSGASQASNAQPLDNSINSLAYIPLNQLKPFSSQ